MSIELGHRLREQREARGVELSALSRQTRIPERQLERLERGDLRALPSIAYVRGFVRAYAEALGMAHCEVAALVAQLAPNSPGLSCEGAHRSLADEVATGSPPRPEGVSVAKVLPVPSPGHRAEAAATSSVPNEGPRVEVALLVVLLAILATLTVSLLLRHPAPTDEGISRCHGCGDGSALLTSQQS